MKKKSEPKSTTACYTMLNVVILISYLLLAVEKRGATNIFNEHVSRRTRFFWRMRYISFKMFHLDVFVNCTGSLQIAPIDVTLRDIPFEFLQKRGILVEMSEWLAQSSNQCLNSTESVRSQQGIQSVSEK